MKHTGSGLPGNRGHTMVELVLTISMIAMVLSATIGLFMFVIGRATTSIVRHSALYDVEKPLQEMVAVISNSISCSIIPVGGRNFLVCTLPTTGVDKDNDGLIDSPTPTGPNKVGKMYYESGRRVWFYTSDTSGAPGVTGRFLFRAVRTDTNNPAVANIDRQWSYLSDDVTPRWQLPGTFEANVDSTDRWASVKITPAIPAKDTAATTRPAFASLQMIATWRCWY